MTILYKVQNGDSGRPDNNQSQLGGVIGASHTGECVLSKISSKNIVAYCIAQEVDAHRGYSNHIYVCDIVTPWQYFTVCTTRSVVTVLEWNFTGDQLLVGYKGGHVEIWSTRQQLLNAWQLLYKACFQSEDIIEAKFFHSGKCLHFHTQKRELPLYADKFERLEYRPTLAHFGSAAMDGCMIVTASGLLGAFIIPKLSATTATAMAASSAVAAAAAGGGGGGAAATGTGAAASAAGPLAGVGVGAATAGNGVDAQSPAGGVQACVELSVSTHSIGLSRSYIASCGLTYCPTGGFKLAVHCGWREQLIHCFRVSVRLEHELELTLAIKCESLASIFLQPVEQKKIAHLRWVAMNSGGGGGGGGVAVGGPAEDIIFVGYNGIGGDAGGLLEQWNLTKKPYQVHKLLQKNKGDFVHIESWEKVAQLHFAHSIATLVLPKLHSDHFQFFAVLHDNSVQMLELDLKIIGSTQFERLTSAGPAAASMAEERERAGAGTPTRFLTADVTPMNQVLVLFDNAAQMYAMQVQWQPPPLQAPPSVGGDKQQLSYKLSLLAQQVALLEYCIITGIDGSDILLLNLPHLDALIERVTENFTRQPTFTRQYYYSNFLSLKSNLCRVQSPRHHDDFDNLIILHSISITFKSLLRPSDLGCQDKGPAENLAMILSEPLPDVDKVLPTLDAKDFTVEPHTLQSLQQLIQWVADLALHILNKLPDEVMKTKMMMMMNSGGGGGQCGGGQGGGGGGKKPGYDISRDIVAIGSIRELLVMIRIWGLLNSQCLPIYTKSAENCDVLAILFRLLTRLAQNTQEPDEMLLDECSILSTQVLIPNKQNNTPTTLLNSHMSMMKSLPLIFTTAVEPATLQDMQVEEVVFANCVKDGVSNLNLGSRAKQVRSCVRCGFVNTMQRMAKTTALKAWCNRWVYCHCGGYWKVV